ncbi:unnamed protein product [Effrenium voratum]|nr:unnamed protein product [Effrenium voratum]
MPNEAVRLFLFDFDQTLSVIHVFKSLAGWPKQVSLPKPHASSEPGQVLRVEELSRDVFIQEGGFPAMAFGGPERVQQMANLLQSLQDAGAELVICPQEEQPESLGGPQQRIESLEGPQEEKIESLGGPSQEEQLESLGGEKVRESIWDCQSTTLSQDSLAPSVGSVEGMEALEDAVSESVADSEASTKKKPKKKKKKPKSQPVAEVREDQERTDTELELMEREAPRKELSNRDSQFSEASGPRKRKAKQEPRLSAKDRPVERRHFSFPTTALSVTSFPRTALLLLLAVLVFGGRCWFALQESQDPFARSRRKH